MLKDIILPKSEVAFHRFILKETKLLRETFQEENMERVWPPSELSQKCLFGKY